MARITHDIEEAIAALKNNLPVAVPTETVYGLAANALNEDAVRSVFEAKQRPADHPLIVHIGNRNDLCNWTDSIPQQALRLIDAFWPGPLTLVLPKKSTVSTLITGGLDTVAVRMPNHPVLSDLLSRIDFALVAPSANAFKHISPTCAEHVVRSLNDRISLVLDGGPCAVGIESTIVAFNSDKPIILRHGAISIEEITAVIGEVEVTTAPTKELRAPGMHNVHYAPRTICYRVDKLNSSNLPSDKKMGIITLLPQVAPHPNALYRALSEKGDLKQAARHLYQFLHELDQLELDMIIIERVENRNQGKALNDRINRASQPYHFNQ